MYAQDWGSEAMCGLFSKEIAPDLSDRVLRVRNALAEADLVVIGASNGLDMAEGLNLFSPDAHFRNEYGDLAQSCGARSILEGFYCSRNDERRLWAWYARFACREWLDYEAGSVLRPLYDLVRNSNYFIVTCNIDARFERTGFSRDRILETEGSVSRMTCSAGCSDDACSTQGIVRDLDASIGNGLVDPDLVPRCPQCGASLVCAVDEMFMAHSDGSMREKVERLKSEVIECAQKGGRMVVLELGVGLRNGVIKAMLAQASSMIVNTSGSELTYAVFNYDQIVFPSGLEQYCIGIEVDMAKAFQMLGEIR